MHDRNVTSGPTEGRRSRLGKLTPSGRPIVPAAWALYDFANTIFSFAVVSGAIGLWLTEDARFGERNGNVLLSVAVIVSVGINAIVSPILGMLSDRAGRRLPFLLFFTVLCIVPTALIGFSTAAIGLALFVVANFAYQAALIYYDATLKVVSLPSTRGTLSGIGVAIGYLGTVFVGLLIFLAEVPVADRFLLSAVLFGLFAVPIFVIVREPRPNDAKPITVRIVLGSWSQLARTIAHAREVPGLLRFLVGRFFYSDAVNTIIVVMSIVAVRAVGLTDTQAILVLLALTVVAIGASFLWGALVDRLGPRRTLLIILASWAIGLTIGGLSLGLENPLKIALFLFAGAILGSGLGGVQVADRVFMVRLSPPERLGEFFGLYGLVGKGSQVIGQLAYGAVIFLLFDSLGTGAYQVAVLSLLVTMVIGAWLIMPVSDRWSGSGEMPHTHGQLPLPERLAPGSAPIEPRTGDP
jgi:MFS transporter, UMF1 family